MSLYQFECTELLTEKKSIIKFQLSSAAIVKLKISRDNRDVRLLLNEPMQQGNHEVMFDYSTLQAGDYVAKLVINTHEVLDIETQIIQIKN